VKENDAQSNYPCFGHGRFLSCTGYASIGDIVASSKEPTLCLFIPSEMFFRIPFFDWYRLREVTYLNKDVGSLITLSKEKYWNNIRAFIRKRNNDADEKQAAYTASLKPDHAH